MATPTQLVDALTNKLSWVVPARTWNRLHYVPGMNADTWDEWWEKDSVPGYRANRMTAICGREIDVDLPGMFSRMGLTRCAHCCDRLGIARGHGAPINDESMAAAVEGARGIF